MSQLKRIKVEGVDANYHAMSRVVGGERLFGDREKEVLRKMLWQVADFCGVEILTYCVMSNHFLKVLEEQDGILPQAAVPGALFFRWGHPGFIGVCPNLRRHSAA